MTSKKEVVAVFVFVIGLLIVLNFLLPSIPGTVTQTQVPTQTQGPPVLIEAGTAPSTRLLLTVAIGLVALAFGIGVLLRRREKSKG